MQLERVHVVFQGRSILVLFDCSAGQLRFNIQECLLFIEVLTNLMPQGSQQPCSRVLDLLFWSLNPGKQARLLSLLVLGTRVAELTTGLF